MWICLSSWNPSREVLKKSVEIRQSLRAEFPLDLIVYDPSYLLQRLAWGDCFLHEITQQGRLLYDAAHAGMGG